MSGKYCECNQKDFRRIFIHGNKGSEEFYNACDLMLIKLYLKLEVRCGFPDVPIEVVEELQKLNLLRIRETRCVITKRGKTIVQNGGLKKIHIHNYSGTDVLLLNKSRFLLERPIFMILILGILLEVCILTWLYSL